eukprot:m.486586 g.486586  ORF g.486586 m.486586 type:complete len:1102 (+) comp24511_c0_seq1:335-3640(+)
MAHQYVVTAHKPTVVTHTAVGHFTSATDLNLIVAKCTHIEAHTVTPEGLVPLVDVNIYGRIAVMQLFRPPGESKDLLFISTESYQFCVLAYDEASGEIVTRAGGDTSSRTGRPADTGQLGLIESAGRLIGLRLYDGMFKVIPIDRSGRLQEAFDLRLEELQVLDMQFLHGCTNPTVAIIYEDAMYRHVKTYAIDLQEKEFVDGPWKQGDVDPEASILIPVPAPFGGCLIVGMASITYHNGRVVKTIAIPQNTITAWGKVDPEGYRYLLGDHVGGLHMLLLQQDGRAVTGMVLERLGTTSIAETLSYLDDGVVYVGSASGDSQLVRLLSESAEDGECIEIIESYVNLGPIVDFAVVDSEKQSQTQIVTCSGSFKDGSLRIVCNGIGIHENATIELPGVQGIWALSSGAESGSPHSMLALSFVGQTAFLSLSGESLEGTEVPGASAAESSLYCGDAVGSQWIQVTERFVRLLCNNSRQMVAQWEHPDPSATISVCACNKHQVVVASGRLLRYFTIGQSTLTPAGEAMMEHEVACVDISPTATSAGPDDTSGKASLCAVGLWTDISVRLLRLNDSLTETHKELIGGEIIPRSIVMAAFESVEYVLCALGDGSVHSFVLDSASGTLSGNKRVQLGTQPIDLQTFVHDGTVHVFAASDRPAVIYSSNRKLLFSNVNVPEVARMCPLNADAFPESLALISKDSLTIGTIDDIQKLQIRKVPLNEMPYRIAHQPSTSTFCVLTTTETDAMLGEDSECIGFVRLLDGQTFEALDSFKMTPFETPCSLITGQFADDDTNYFIVGTAVAKPTEDEPQAGFIRVFKVVDGKFSLESELSVKGAVYSMCVFNGKLLAGINNKVYLYSWMMTDGGAPELTAECGHHGHILALYLKCRGDFVLVGDLMRSMSLLQYKPMGGTLEEIAADANCNWMSAVEVIDDDTFLGAENGYNIFTCKRNSDSSEDDERQRLDVVGEFHVGQFINVFQHGTLGMAARDGTDSAHESSILYGTVTGSIGLVVTLSRSEFEFLVELEQLLEKVIQGVGGLSHEAWRSFKNERRQAAGGARGCVDGDLIEAFLDLPQDKMREVALGFKTPLEVEQLVRRVEDLTRLH